MSKTQLGTASFPWTLRPSTYVRDTNLFGWARGLPFAITSDLSIFQTMHNTYNIRTKVTNILCDDVLNREFNERPIINIDIQSTSFEDALSIVEDLAKLKVVWTVRLEFATSKPWDNKETELFNGIAQLQYISSLDIMDHSGVRYEHLVGIPKRQTCIKFFEIAIDDTNTDQVNTFLKSLENYPACFSLRLLYGQMDGIWGTGEAKLIDIVHTVKKLSDNKKLIELDIRCNRVTYLEHLLKNAFKTDPLTNVFNSKFAWVKQKTLVIDWNQTDLNPVESNKEILDESHGQVSLLFRRLAFIDIRLIRDLDRMMRNRYKGSYIENTPELLFDNCTVTPMAIKNIMDDYPTVKRLTFINCGIISTKHRISQRKSMYKSMRGEDLSED